MPVEFVAGDTGSVLEVAFTRASDGSAFDLTGCTIAVKWRIAGGSLVTKAMSAVSPLSGGLARYQFTTNDLVQGKMVFEFEVTDGTGAVISSQVVMTTLIRGKV